MVSGTRRWPSAVFSVLGWVAVAFYVAQHGRLGPNHVDGGLLLGYIQTIAEGGRPYFDFVDLYGLASWPLPALFYIAAGQKVWGLRLWLVVAKLAALALSFVLARRLSGADRWAWGAVVLLAILLGLPWQLLQTIYAFLPTLVLELGAIALVLRRPSPTPWHLAGAGVLTGLALCTKLNGGAMLWAGLMFVAFYCPAVTGGAARAVVVGRGLRRLTRIAQVAGLLAYATVFQLFIREFYNGLYALYLTVPLLLMLAWAARNLPAPAAFTAHVRAWAICALVPPLSALLLLGAYLGSALPDYLRDMGAILARLEYARPIPPIGKAGHYVGFNEFLWPQFPWLVTLVFALWWRLCGRRDSTEGRGSGDPSWVAALFAFHVCKLFVMYSRTDESHLHQAMLLGAVLLPTMWSGVVAHASANFAPGFRQGALRFAGPAFIVFACATLGTRPRGELLASTADSWGTPRLAGIRYARDPDPYVRPFHPRIGPRRWDQITDLAARYIDQHTEDGAEVFVLARNELLNFASHTRPAGGRDRYYWYLFKNEHFRAEDVRAVAPPDLVRRLWVDPPTMIVRAFRDNRIEQAFPAVGLLVKRRYRMARSFQHLTIYALKPPARAGAAGRPDRPSTLPDRDRVVHQ